MCPLIQARSAGLAGSKPNHECLAKLKAAYETLHDFRSGDFKDVADVVGAEESGRSLAHVG
jgi:hypothetical protein